MSSKKKSSTICCSYVVWYLSTTYIESTHPTASALTLNVKVGSGRKFLNNVSRKGEDIMKEYRRTSKTWEMKKSSLNCVNA